MAQQHTPCGRARGGGGGGGGKGGEAFIRWAACNQTLQFFHGIPIGDHSEISVD